MFEFLLVELTGFSLFRFPGLPRESVHISVSYRLRVLVLTPVTKSRRGRETLCFISTAQSAAALVKMRSLTRKQSLSYRPGPGAGRGGGGAPDREVA